MKRTLVLLLLVAAGCGPPPWAERPDYPAPRPEQTPWWNALSQEDRDARILEQARADEGRFTGLNCKEWVREVVIRASQGGANIPPTCGGWKWCESPHATRMNVTLSEARPGWIVQTERTGGGGSRSLHTAIVFARDSEGVWWLDSNWLAPDTAGLHYESFADFNRSVCRTEYCYYALYRITPH